MFASKAWSNVKVRFRQSFCHHEWQWWESVRLADRLEPTESHMSMLSSVTIVQYCPKCGEYGKSESMPPEVFWNPHEKRYMSVMPWAAKAPTGTTSERAIFCF